MWHSLSTRAGTQVVCRHGTRVSQLLKHQSHIPGSVMGEENLKDLPRKPVIRERNEIDFLSRNRDGRCYREGQTDKKTLLLPGDLLIFIRSTRSSCKLGSVTFAQLLMINASLVKLP